MPPRSLSIALAVLSALLMGGCDMLGDSADKLAAVKDAEGRAIGGACRHAARAIEDCYAMNKKADKAAIFAGWRDMNDYMRENKIEPVTPQAAAPAASSKSAKLEKAEKGDKAEKAASTERPEGKPGPAAPVEPAEMPVQIEKKPAKATPKPQSDRES